MRDHVVDVAPDPGGEPLAVSACSSVRVAGAAAGG